MATTTFSDPNRAAPSQPTTGRPETAALPSRMRSGFLWKLASQGTAQASRTVMTIILAHLLAPTDFGLAGLVLVFAGLLQLLSDVGLSASIVQFETVTEEDCSTAFWTGLAAASACFAVAFVVSPYVAEFYGHPSVRWMFVALCSTMITGALCTTQASLLWRRMDFRALELREIVAASASAALGIACGFAGLGAWSLIVAAVTMSVMSTAMIWVVSPWKPSFTFSFASLRRMASFSSSVFFSRFLNLADRNADNLLVGRFLGPAALGIYAIGYSVILLPFQRLLFPIQNVMIPALASLQRDVRGMRDLWLRTLRLVAALLFPTSIGIIIVCPDFVTVVLGSKWHAATPVIQILAWVALIQALTAAAGPVFQSTGRAGLLLRVSAGAFLIDLTAFAFGLRWGVRGVASAYALTNTVLIVPVTLALVISLLEARPVQVIRELRGVIEATVVMAAVAIAVRKALEAAQVGTGLRLLAVVVIAALAYGLMCLWRERRLFGELRGGRLQPVGAA